MRKLSLPSPHFWPRLLLGMGLSILGAGLLYFSMPPYGLWPLAFLGFVPMLLAQHRILPPRLSSLAPALTIGGFWGAFIPSVFGPFADHVLFLKYLGILVGVLVFFTDLGNRRLHERTGYRWFVLEGTFVWVGIEMIRNLIPFLGTAGFIGYAYYRSPWLIQPISIFGIFGLNLLNLLVGYALGLGCLALFDRWSARRPAWLVEAAVPVEAPLARRWLGGVGIAAAAWAALSLVLYLWPIQTPAVQVAAVQPGGQKLEDLFRLTREAAAQGAQLVVWPEGALHFDPKLEHTAEIKALAAESGAYLVMGVGIKSSQGLRNEAVVLSPAGEFLGTYGKDHPMTYLGERSITRGSYPTFSAPFGTFGAIICYDLNFNDTARKIVRNGARIIAVPSNDWPALYDKQIAYLVFRSVENRVTTIKADTAYDSLVIGPRGRLIASRFSPVPSQGVLAAEAPVGPAGTLYLHLGDWLGWLSLAGMAFFTLPNPLLSKPRLALADR